MADDPIHNRDLAHRKLGDRAASGRASRVCAQRRLWMGYSVLGGRLVRRALGLRWVGSSPQPGACAKIRRWSCRPRSAAPGVAEESERSFRALEAGCEACSSYAEASYRKRRNGSSSTRRMADDPIHHRDWADRCPGGIAASGCAGRVCAQRRMWMGYSVLGGALVRRALGLR